MPLLPDVRCKTSEYGVGKHRILTEDKAMNEKPIRFDLDLIVDSFSDFCNSAPGNETYGVIDCQGFFHADGLVRRSKCYGKLELRVFSEKKLRYTLFFDGENGRHYKYVGEKVNISPWNLMISFFTCYGTIYDSETLAHVSESTVYL